MHRLEIESSKDMTKVKCLHVVHHMANARGAQMLELSLNTVCCLSELELSDTSGGRRITQFSLTDRMKIRIVIFNLSSCPYSTQAD